MKKIVSPRQQRGFSLLEVLIATVVLSIGLLGLASLQTASLRNNNGALHRSQATIMAYDILDCMRANQKEAQLGTYDIGYTQTSTNSGVVGKDINTWKQDLTQLPQGDGQIKSSGNDVTISIRWLDIDQNNQNGKHYETVTLDTQL